MTRVEKGEKSFLEGYNCSQSVVLAFIDDIKIDRDLACKLSSSFGGGIGRMREVCGVVSGMAFVLGFYFGTTEGKDAQGKMELYKKVQEVANKFKEINGSIICKELLGVNEKISPIPEERNKEYYKKRPCNELVKIGVEILENYLQSNGKI